MLDVVFDGHNSKYPFIMYQILILQPIRAHLSPSQLLEEFPRTVYGAGKQEMRKCDLPEEL